MLIVFLSIRRKNPIYNKTDKKSGCNAVSDKEAHYSCFFWRQNYERPSVSFDVLYILLLAMYKTNIPGTKIFSKFKKTIENHEEII